MSATLTTTPQASAVPFVKQTRLIPAARQAVYDAWTQPEILKKWWGPAGYIITAVDLDVREGGDLRIADEALPHVEVPAGIPRSVVRSGTYTEVVPGERLQFTMRASWNPGQGSLITVSFRDAEGGTEIVILHERIPADQAHLYSAGWTQVLDKLDALFAA
jgi:uncharacterized protein YndB with AHSA1/START domain